MIGARVGLGRFARAVLPSQVVAMSTSSSLATLPTMLKSSEELGAPRQRVGRRPADRGRGVPRDQPRDEPGGRALCRALDRHHDRPGAARRRRRDRRDHDDGVGQPAGHRSFFASVAPVSVAMGVPIEALGLLVAVETVPDLFRTVGNVTMDVAVTATISARSGGGSEGEIDRAIEEIPG